MRDERRSPEHLAKELFALGRRLDRYLLREPPGRARSERGSHDFVRFDPVAGGSATRSRRVWIFDRPMV